jgi:methenyltetrahydromethanopterin cyclohydrolase
LVEIKLQLKKAPKVPVFAEALSPKAFAGKSSGEIEELPLLEGGRSAKLGEFFDVKVQGEPAADSSQCDVTLKGDLSKFRYVGKGMDGGKLVVEGNVGFYLGEEMAGGSITVKGNAASWTGSMMAGGQIEVFGNTGDYLAAPYRGVQEGMLNGSIIVHGNTGTHAGLWMRGGVISVDGNAGQFLGHRMQDGVILVKGNCGPRVGAAMKGGRIIVQGEVAEILPSFTYTEIKDKAKVGAEKIPASFYVYTGDSLEGGSGKLFVSRCRNRRLNPEGEVFPEGVSVNQLTVPLVEKLINEAERLGVQVTKHSSGAVVVDVGLKAKGSEEAGKIVTLICLGNLAEISIGREKYGEDLELPTLYETTTGHPAVATLGAQFAGWAIKTEDYFAMGSGPARALSLQPKKLYQKLCYKDEAKVAVILLEADSLPTESALKLMAETCNVPLEGLYVLIASTSSLVGSVQIAGRVVETGIHKLTELGFNPNKILKGKGSAPIAPVHPKSEVAMGITNDMILYGGDVYYEVACKTDDEIINIIDEAPSIASRDYGKPFYETFKEAGGDFYKIDPGLFAPAKITLHNVKTGNTFTAGKISAPILKRSLALLKTP